MADKEIAPEFVQRNIEELRRHNIADNKRMLALIMADLENQMPPSLHGGKKRKRSETKKNNQGVGPIRRNPARSARSSLTRVDPPATRSRSSSMSSTSSSLSSPSRLVVKFGFGREGASEYSSDQEEEEGKPHSVRACALRDQTPADEITGGQLKLVAQSTREKSYDSIYGSTCHQCRQKTSDMKSICRSGFCAGMRGQFCGPCLRNRYGEDVTIILKDPEWQCPPCRRICNCSICLRRQGRACTGILVHLAKERGFSNVNDYLQSLKNRYMAQTKNTTSKEEEENTENA